MNRPCAPGPVAPAPGREAGGRAVGVTSRAGIACRISGGGGQLSQVDADGQGAVAVSAVIASGVVWGDVTKSTLAGSSTAQDPYGFLNLHSGDKPKGKVLDVRLEPQDIVYVPFKPWRYLSKYADIAMKTFVSSVAINEGSHAVLGVQANPAGVFIPLGSSVTVQPPVPVR